MVSLDRMFDGQTNGQTDGQQMTKLTDTRTDGCMNRWTMDLVSLFLHQSVLHIAWLMHSVGWLIPYAILVGEWVGTTTTYYNMYQRYVKLHLTTSRVTQIQIIILFYLNCVD